MNNNGSHSNSLIDVNSVDSETHKSQVKSILSCSNVNTYNNLTSFKKNTSTYPSSIFGYEKIQVIGKGSFGIVKYMVKLFRYGLEKSYLASMKMS
jgi:hypothetical protein